MTEELVLLFLRQRGTMLNLKGIADAAGINQRTLRDYVDGTRGKRGLSADTVASLANAIEGLRAPWAPQGGSGISTIYPNKINNLRNSMEHYLGGSDESER